MVSEIEVSAEEAAGWIRTFRLYCEGQKMEISYANKEFLALERAYWLGITERGGIPVEIHRMLYSYKSPVLESIAPSKKRTRRTKAQIEADKAAQGQAASAL